MDSFHSSEVDDFPLRTPSASQLAVHKRKVDETRMWLACALCRSGSCVALLTGPPGCGKSTCVRAVAAEAGVDVVEYCQPAPMLWEEQRRLNEGACVVRGRGDVFIGYNSKAADFERFLEQAVSFPALRLKAAGKGESKRRMVLIDDLPHAHGIEAERALLSAIDRALSRASAPVAIVLTDEAVPVGVSTFLESLAAQRGARHIKFNPVAKRAMVAALEAAAPLVSRQVIEAIESSAKGDLRHALAALHFHLSADTTILARPVGVLKRKRRTLAVGDDGAAINLRRRWLSAGAGRSETLSVFHALGKILNNKRDDSGASLVNPEDALEASKLEPERVLEFLFENTLDFVNAESTDDLACASRALSDGAALLGDASRIEFTSRFGQPRGETDTRIATAAAASVVMRGVMSSLRAECPKLGFRQMRAPRAPQTAREARRREAQMVLRCDTPAAQDVPTALEIKYFRDSIDHTCVAGEDGTAVADEIEESSERE